MIAENFEYAINLYQTNFNKFADEFILPALYQSNPFMESNGRDSDLLLFMNYLHERTATATGNNPNGIPYPGYINPLIPDEPCSVYQNSNGCLTAILDRINSMNT